jgi:phosphoenolpyruvate carboxylase
VSPLDEVRAGLVVFEQTLWEALPQYLRSLDRALRAATGEALPLDAAPIRFGSWIGGDRDGNPSVTPEVTRQATWLARWMAAHLYLADVEALRNELSLASASDELRTRVPESPEPYRALLREVVARMAATREWAAENVRSPRGTRTDDGPTEEHGNDVFRDHGSLRAPRGQSGPSPYVDVADFAEPLQLCYRSLVSTGNAVIAAGRLTDILRRIAAFGLTLARLDLRQESSRHAEAVDWIARARGLGAYENASEDDRLALLLRELTITPRAIADDELAGAPDSVRDVIDTFRTAAALHLDSLGAYVVTMAHQASDVLAVELLQRLAGACRPQRVVPLFETADDLNRAGAVLDVLLGIPWYRDRTALPSPTGPPAGRVEVMVGYSDSAKDAGRFAAAWALYRAQEQIVASCRRHGVAVTLFHGRGGSIGRGGGPTYLAIQSQPPGSVDGTLRVTEQGEMIQSKFGVVDIAARSLEVYTTATLDAMLLPARDAEPRWRGTMDRLYEEGRAAYRAIVHEHPRFVDYFRAATPEPELRAIHIGSRPARRSAAGGVEGLRAIPWQFAWTQTRLLLASWLGIETALEAALARGERDELRAMYAQWPFFRSTLDLMEMVLAKADARIAAEYDRRLVPPDLQPLGREMRARLARATAAVLEVTGHGELVETNRVLRRSIDTRNPYVDPINLVQIELLKRLRQSPDSPELRHAFTITVNGIAAGMRNTG